MGRKRKPKESDRFGLGLIISMGIVLIVLYSVVFYKTLHSKPKQSGQASAGTVPVYYMRAQDAMPLPATLEPGAFNRTDVHQAYQVAK